MAAPKFDSISGVAQLSTQLVQQWLMIVKGTAGQIQQQVQAQNQIQVQTQSQNESSPHQTDDTKTEDVKPVVTNDAINTENVKAEQKIDGAHDSISEGISTGTFYKTAGKDGTQSTRKSSVESKSENDDASDDTDKSEDRKDVKDKDKFKTKSSRSNKHRSKERDDKKSERDSEKDKKKSSSSSKSSSKHKSTSSSRSRDDKDKDRHRDKGKEKERDKNKEKNKDKDKSRDADKDKHRSNGGLKHLSTPKKGSKDHRDKSKEKSKHDENDKYDEKDKEKLAEKEKEKQIEKDNNTLEKLKPPTIDKLGRIPKKTSVVDDKSKESSFDMRKKAFSVGIRKDKENEDRPKTVKVFNSKMRSTGLEEEVKPATPRSATTNKKPISSVQLPTIPQKRPSPPKDIREPFVPPEKKLKMDKIDGPERPGAIKLIPPKPKRKFMKTLYSFLFYFYRCHRKAGGSILQHLAGACFSHFCR